MNNTKEFDFNDPALRQQTDKDGNRWYCAKDVLRILGLSDNKKALAEVVELKAMGKADAFPVETSVGLRRLDFLSKSGVQVIILGSTVETAAPYKDWIIDRMSGWGLLESADLAALEHTGELPDIPIPRSKEALAIERYMRLAEAAEQSAQFIRGLPTRIALEALWYEYGVGLPSVQIPLVDVRELARSTSVAEVAGALEMSEELATDCLVSCGYLIAPAVAHG